MITHLLALADRARVDQFALIGSARSSRHLFADYQTWTDSDGVAWAGKRLDGHCLAFTWLGPGWSFDPHAPDRAKDRIEVQRNRMHDASRNDHNIQFNSVLRRILTGVRAERLLWLIHQQAFVSRTSSLRLPDIMLATVIWGRNQEHWPRHWRQVLLHLLQGLSWLHVADWIDHDPPALGPQTALLAYAADLRASSNDACGKECPAYGSDLHHHYLITLGRGFFGKLEEFGREIDSGIRTYDFARGGPKTKGPCLWRIGKTGSLRSIFLPAFLGDPEVCASFTLRQHRLIQALVRETTRARSAKGAVAEAAVFSGDLIPDFLGRGQIVCSSLAQSAQLIAFTGNGKRKGLGYLLASPGGWAAKAGYEISEINDLLDDLVTIADPLGLTVIGINPSSTHFSLDRMRGLIATSQGRQIVERLHIRVYTSADYLDRWKRHFGIAGSDSEPKVSLAITVADLLAEMKIKQVSRRALADGIGADWSFVSKILAGKKPPPQSMLEQARHWLSKRDGETHTVSPHLPRSRNSERDANHVSMLDIALGYLDQGWCVVPQRAGEKKPCVRWKHLQERLPTVDEMKEWFDTWPDAGLALILGPVSGVFVIDVDGSEAHDALLQRLVTEPRAPKVVSGSRKPDRYHLFFRCPDLATKAKQTPWHPNLEFRGLGGLVIIPPSIHRSGHCYEWVEGQSLDDLALPDLPSKVIQSLTPTPPVHFGWPSSTLAQVGEIDASPRTRAFLTGKFADGPRWNDRLFSAACDLQGRGMPIEKAEPLLLRGACPWSIGDEALARRTIRSAFSQRRNPSTH